MKAKSATKIKKRRHNCRCMTFHGKYFGCATPYLLHSTYEAEVWV